MAHPLHIATPLLPSATLSAACGRQVRLKMEALQPPGSFKIRGIGLACQTHAQAGKRRFMSSSGGNAGLAVAYAGQCLHIPVTVVVPQTTSAHAQALLRQYGAEVIVHGSTWNEANALAQTLLGPQDAFIHPFDDPLLWAGHASMVDEVIAAGFTPDAVVTAVGGGGLLCGVARKGWRSMVWAMCPSSQPKQPAQPAWRLPCRRAHPPRLMPLPALPLRWAPSKCAHRPLPCRSSAPSSAMWLAMPMP